MTYEEGLTHSGSLSSLRCPGWGNGSSGEECSRTRRRAERRGCPSPGCGAAAARVGREPVRSAMAPPVAGVRIAPRGLETRRSVSAAPARPILCLILWLADQPPPTRPPSQTTPVGGGRTSDRGRGESAKGEEVSIPSATRHFKCIIFIIFMNLFYCPRARYSSSDQPCEVGISIPPILQMGKLRHGQGNSTNAQWVRLHFRCCKSWFPGPEPATKQRREGKAVEGTAHPLLPKTALWA